MLHANCMEYWSMDLRRLLSLMDRIMLTLLVSWVRCMFVLCTTYGTMYILHFKPTMQPRLGIVFSITTIPSVHPVFVAQVGLAWFLVAIVGDDTD